MHSGNSGVSGAQPRHSAMGRLRPRRRRPVGWSFHTGTLIITYTILNRLRRTRTTGIRSTGLICKGPKTLFMFVFGKLCLYLFCFVFFCLYLSFFVFICLYLSLFVFVCLLFVTASCCSTWDLASSSMSTIHRRGLSPPWCEFVF